jgi:microsomal dipeptidase-like Zn-dependent dipeptidase
MGSIAGLHSLFELGIRSAQLTWNGPNELADGVGVPQPGGLTKLGRDAVHEMQRIGVLVDVSHLAPDGSGCAGLRSGPSSRRTRMQPRPAAPRNPRQ